MMYLKTRLTLTFRTKIFSKTLFLENDVILCYTILNYLQFKFAFMNNTLSAYDFIIEKIAIVYYFLLF